MHAIILPLSTLLPLQRSSIPPQDNYHGTCTTSHTHTNATIRHDKATIPQGRPPSIPQSRKTSPSRNLSPNSPINGCEILAAAAKSLALTAPSTLKLLVPTHNLIHNTHHDRRLRLLGPLAEYEESSSDVTIGHAREGSAEDEVEVFTREAGGGAREGEGKVVDEVCCAADGEEGHELACGEDVLDGHGGVVGWYDSSFDEIVVLRHRVARRKDGSDGKVGSAASCASGSK
ncbi:uncharacterized protein MYCGRDRAFT_92993 [Zymoseptoria tritici IPO323]|uniref:Uncharacterized protein n=1 Tax=Zymoseptoria tritici (strain CBS 115943 / IPO323) TaxID=336722 RepID=F9XAP1_ZYMTI|nr:uncharacterized protein MYCGRDRAFT_92993 [Zymoseptoria tritici IPO323]EGP87034.1 hypothetical protein MYCGRDRAFT_92993 [Zymoseptoria tritici IPO323]